MLPRVAGIEVRDLSDSSMVSLDLESWSDQCDLAMGVGESKWLALASYRAI